jgi:hypothetical protein
MPPRKPRFSRRLAQLIRQCEAAFAVWQTPFADVAFPSTCECPACEARGLSVVDDEAGRFRSCLVCGSSAVYVAQDA